MLRAYIDGQAGTTGLQIQARLEKHPEVELLRIDEDKRRCESERRRLMEAADVVFLCLPEDAAAEAARLCEGSGAVVIDSSTAHRVSPGWAYGLPELSRAHREAVRGAKRIANPGCHATGFLAVAYPLVASGAVQPDYPFSCHSLTGYSGGGKKMIAQYEDAGRPSSLDAPRPYALSQNHKHLPEMAAVAGLAAPPVFCPIVCDYYSGMAVTAPLHPRHMAKPLSLRAVFDLYRAHYEGEPLIEVVLSPEGDALSAGELSGTDRLRLTVTGNDDRIAVTALFDNLGKGASGAAVQNMNLALGLPETLSLALGGTPT